MKNKYYSGRIKPKDDEKMLSELDKLKVKCDCGHIVIMPVYQDKTICSFCGKKITNNTKLHFLYKMRKEIQKTESK